MQHPHNAPGRLRVHLDLDPHLLLRAAMVPRHELELLEQPREGVLHLQARKVPAETDPRPVAEREVLPRLRFVCVPAFGPKAVRVRPDKVVAPL